MLDHRKLKADCAALALLAAGVFLGLALLSYSAGDPPGRQIWPAEPGVGNLCGRIGAQLAWGTLSLAGVGAYYVVVSLIGLALVVLSGKELNEPVLRSVGWGLSFLGLTVLAAMALPSFGSGPVIGPGGYIGAAGRTLLHANFASAGAYILVLSLIVGGLLLSTDYVLVRVSAWLLRRPATAMGRAIVRAAPARLRRPGATPRRSDLDTADAVANDVAVRISGKAVDEPDDEAADSADAGENAATADAAGDATTADEDSATTSAARPSFAKRVASALKIKGPSREAQRQEVMAELDAAIHSDKPANYELPSLELLERSEPISYEEQEKEVRRRAKILEKTFANFGFNVKVVEIETGPVIAQFEVELEAGLRLSKITSLADDLAIALRVPSVRIVAPIPGKNTVGVEVPNTERQLVCLREVIEEASAKAKKQKIPIFLGKDVAGNPLIVDLASLPHLLIAGRTGTGKSVCLNSIIVSLLMTRSPDEVRMLLIDPKMVELSPYKTLPHLMHPVVTDMHKAEAILAWAVDKMEERYALLARAGVRHISAYNQLGVEELMERLQPETDEDRAQIPTNLPYIVIVADEMADLMMTAAKEVEGHIIRLAQKSRAVGIHLVLATQKPTVDVITGLIKSNLPARISFQVASRTDSRVVLDEMGADKLLGNGDMLFLWPGTSTLIRGQGTYVSDDEINRVVDFVGTTEPDFVAELVQLKASAGPANAERLKSRDDLYESAVEVVIREGRGSVSLLQRALGIGYGRAARLIDYMAEDGVVGQYNGSQARDVLITLEQWAEMIGEQAEPEPPARLSRNKIAPAPATAANHDEPPKSTSLVATKRAPWEGDDDDEPMAEENSREEESDGEVDVDAGDTDDELGDEDDSPDDPRAESDDDGHVDADDSPPRQLPFRSQSA